MKIGEERKLVSVGGSQVITLPKWWLHYHKAKPGDAVIVSSTNGGLKINYKKRTKARGR